MTTDAHQHHSARYASLGLRRPARLMASMRGWLGGEHDSRTRHVASFVPPDPDALRIRASHAAPPTRWPDRERPSRTNAGWPPRCSHTPAGVITCLFRTATLPRRPGRPRVRRQAPPGSRPRCPFPARRRDCPSCEAWRRHSDRQLWAQLSRRHRIIRPLSAIFTLWPCHFTDCQFADPP